MIRNILILGGTGFVGRSLCEALVERSGGAGGRIVVPSRQPQRALHIRTLPTVEVVPADIHDEACLTRLLQGMDVVINLVAILHGRESDFEKVHVELLRKLVRACKTSGVQRVVHVSALGVCEPPQQAPSHYLRSKGLGEQVLKTSPGLSCTILRPSVIFGEHDRFLNMFAQLQTCLPLIALAGGSAQFQPVWVADVAAAIVKVLDQPETAGQTIECAGPEVMSLADIVRCAGIWSGHPRPVASLPLSLGYPQALLMELLPGVPLMSRDNVSSMKVPNVASGRLPSLQSLGITPSAMSSVMPDVLGHRLGPARLEAWRTPGSN